MLLFKLDTNNKIKSICLTLDVTTSNLIKFLLNLSYKLDCIFVIFSSSKIKLSLEKSKFILLEVKKKKVLEKI